MGGSSLGPAVLASAFGTIGGNPQFYMLDSTVPAQIKATEEKLDLTNTIFIVSSKSGSTLEPNILKDYFFEKVKAKLGAAEARRRFIAITDPGSHLEQIAKTEGFRYIFYGLPSIGGRYSVLSAFGMVPAAVMGIDLPRLLDRTELMVQACAASVPATDNPGVILGIILGVMANCGRDKITFIVSPAIADFAAWSEQLLAESTGKSGKGLIPIVGEYPGQQSDYGNDRLFVYMRLKKNPDQAQDQFFNELERARQPVIRIELDDIYNLGQEFFRFEIATAVAGSIMDINPFNQPDVEAAKVAARNLTNEYENSGALVQDPPLFTWKQGDVVSQIFTDQTNWTKISEGCDDPKSLIAILRCYLSQISPGDYATILAYLEMNAVNQTALQSIRQTLHDNLKIATCLGFGPRYLHSTGQVYKGGPNTGIFLLLTAGDSVDFPVPDKKYTFSVVKMAQALGDFQVLAKRQRRVLRIHFSHPQGDISECLALLHKILKDACSSIVRDNSKATTALSRRPTTPV